MPEGTQGHCWPRLSFVYGGLTLSAAPSQVLPLEIRVPLCRPYNPESDSDAVWAIPRSLAATEGVSFDFLSFGYLDVSVPRVGSAEAVTPVLQRWVSPFGHPRFIACLPAPRGLSQTTTSFIASYCLGIHRMHLIA